MTASVAAAQKAARACFKPEYQFLAALLDESILRNPEGWETWFAIKNDETDSARTQRVCSHPDGWSERGMGDDRWQECWLCGEQRERTPAR